MTLVEYEREQVKSLRKKYLSASIANYVVEADRLETIIELCELKANFLEEAEKSFPCGT